MLLVAKAANTIVEKLVVLNRFVRDNGFKLYQTTVRLQHPCTFGHCFLKVRTVLVAIDFVGIIHGYTCNKHVIVVSVFGGASMLQAGLVNMLIAT